MEKLDGTVSTLYHISPFGWGTGRVQSLTSYIAYLAKEHNVEVGGLLREEVLPLLGKYQQKRVGRPVSPILYQRSFSANGLDMMALDFCKAMEKLTLQGDLKSTTLIRLGNCLSTFGLLRETKSWCPVCISDAKENDEIIYEPLAWGFQDYNICPIHQVKMQDECSCCGAKLTFLSGRARNGYCPRCHNFLGSHLDKSKLKTNSSKEVAISRMIEDLILNSQHMIVDDHRAVALENLIGQVMNDKTILKSTKKGNLPKMQTLLRVGDPLQLTLSDWFYAPLSEIRSKLEKVSVIIPDEQKERRRCRTKRQLGDIKKSLHQELNELVDHPPEPPIPLSSIADRSNVAVATLYRWFPDLCKKITSHRKEYLLKYKQQRYLELKNEIREVMAKLMLSGNELSFGAVVRALDIKTFAPEIIIKEMWEEELLRLKKPDIKIRDILATST